MIYFLLLLLFSFLLLLLLLFQTNNKPFLTVFSNAYRKMSILHVVECFLFQYSIWFFFHFYNLFKLLLLSLLKQTIFFYLQIKRNERIFCISDFNKTMRLKQEV